MRVPSLGWEDSLEEEMATHSLILAWRIPWTEELDEMQSTGSHRVRHDWSDLAGMHTLGRGGSFMAFLREGCSFFFFPGHSAWLVGFYFPDQGLNPGSQQWEPGILTPVPPWSSQNCSFWLRLCALGSHYSSNWGGVCVSVSSVFFYFKFHFLHF